MNTYDPCALYPSCWSLCAVLTGSQIVQDCLLYQAMICSFLIICSILVCDKFLTSLPCIITKSRSCITSTLTRKLFFFLIYLFNMYILQTGGIAVQKKERKEQKEKYINHLSTSQFPMLGYWESVGWQDQGLGHCIYQHPDVWGVLEVKLQGHWCVENITQLQTISVIQHTILKLVV